MNTEDMNTEDIKINFSNPKFDINKVISKVNNFLNQQEE